MQSGFKETVLIPLGLLLQLQQEAIVKGFMALAKDESKLQPGKQFDLSKVPAVLALDAKFKAGLLEVDDFRAGVLTVLGFNAKVKADEALPENKKEVTDEEFDTIWCAMQLNVAELASKIKEIKSEIINRDLILVSATNPVHIQQIFAVAEPDVTFDEEKLEHPYTLQGLPLYVSYRTESCKTNTDIQRALYTEAAKDKAKVAIVIQLKSDGKVQAAKERDEANALKLKEWAIAQGWRVIEREPGVALIDVLKQSSRRNSLDKLGLMSSAVAVLTTEPEFVTSPTNSK